MKRRSSTTAAPAAIDRTLDNTQYSVIAGVAEELDAIEDIQTAIDDGTLDNMLNIINMEVATGAEGTDAVWDGTTLTVPKGDTGEKGDAGNDGNNGGNGLTPNYEFTYNPSTGDLEYTLTNYSDINDLTIQEW